MSRSLSYLRRGLLGIAFVGSLGFGATQAFGSPMQAREGTCEQTGGPYIPPGGTYDPCGHCLGGGFCDGRNSECVCFEYEPLTP
jgi:hypothetical protein